MTKALTLAAMAICVCAGCDEEKKSSPDASPDASPAPVPQVAAPAEPEKPAFKHEYTLEVKKNAAGHAIVTWTATVPSGGWKLITESVLVETPLAKLQARVYSTLEAPAPDEMVTQALTTVTAEYDAGDKNVEEAELSVRETVRNVKTPWQPLYGVVKEFPEK